MNSRLAVVLALSLAAVACGPKVTKDQPGAQDPAYMFPHSTHVDAEVDCKLCHPMDKATKLETGVRHVQLPKNPAKNAACQDCHDTDVEFPAPERARPFRLSFSHAEHLPRVNGDCKRCHPTPPESGDAAAKTPPMETCTSCHTHQQDFLQAQCKPCHLDLKGYEPQTAFKHQGDWLRAHGSLARPSAETCASCHDQTYCAECHSPQTAAARPSVIFPERVDRAFIHRGDYVSRHMIEAGANPASCRRCHGSAFCQACHTQQGLDATLGAGTRWPESHDRPNWVIPATPGTRPAHAPAAKRDISSCGGCHDGGGSASCVGCHQVGGIATQGPGASPNGPHPSSFVRKHRGEDKDGMCAACHH
jgi:hypothetical protein